MTLFQAVTGDTLPDLVIHGIDTVDVDVAPQPRDWKWEGLYFIAWILVGHIMATNLFIGAIVDYFIAKRKVIEGTALLTMAQQQWVNVHKHIRHLRASKRPHPPTLPPIEWGRLSRQVLGLRLKLYQLVLSKGWQNAMLLTLVLNLQTLAFDYHAREERHPQFHAALQLVAEAFFYWYWLEFAIKMIGLGWGGYFSDGGRVFEFAMLALSILERNYTAMHINPVLLRVLRLSRVLKTLKLLVRAKDVQALLHTLLQSIPAVLNVVVILVVVTLIYAVAGMQLFTFVKQNHGLNAHANFETLGGACLLLFQALTGDGWSEIMLGAMVDVDEGCDAEAIPSDCGSWLAIPFFCSYVVIGNLILLNLVVAVVIETFAETKRLQEEQALRRESNVAELVTADHIEDFVRVWALVDKNADNMVSIEKLAYVVAKCKHPLGLSGRRIPTHANQPLAAAGVASPPASVLAEPEENEQDEVATWTQLTAALEAHTVWAPSVSLERLEEAELVVEDLLKLMPDGEQSRDGKLLPFLHVLDSMVDNAFLHARDATLSVEQIEQLVKIKQRLYRHPDADTML